MTKDLTSSELMVAVDTKTKRVVVSDMQEIEDTTRRPIVSVSIGVKATAVTLLTAHLGKEFRDEFSP